MGCYEGWAHQNGFYPNGLLPDEAASVTRFLDPDRWLVAEERTGELIACIQPNQPSEERRNAVASYVHRLITSCFSCEVFTFGSVPLKTYLPDGDIDLTAFGKNENLKDTWSTEVRDMLEKEEKSVDAEFRVKEVQYIQAEVKIIKCLVDNIVVDISFNQLGGLCTLYFLEEVDRLVSQNHLFKRSIILIKAWCYYESRILGAHHGLISTYALETLVLYIFHVFNNSFAGPLEVLYRFLEFFSKFDWDNFCVSLWGPVPITSLPDMTADSPRKDGGELLLNKVFLDACGSVYSVFPSARENQELPFISKHFNISDPLRANNNLGRSVSKGNFFRIRSALAFGAQRLARLLDCPKQNIIAEVNQFFTNTLDRHGKGQRPDAPSPDLCAFQLDNNHLNGSSSLRSSSSSENVKENPAGHESEAEIIRASHIHSQHSNQSLKQASRQSSMPIYPHTQNQKTYMNLARSVEPDQATHNNTNGNARAFEDGSYRTDRFGNELQTSCQFARTQSSPELMDKVYHLSSQGRHNRTSEKIKGQTATRSDYGKRRNLSSGVSENCNATSPSEDLPTSWQSSFQQRIHGSSNSYHGESGLGRTGEDRPGAEALQMQQEEQDFVNMMAFSIGNGVNGHVRMALNSASAHLPVPLSPSMLASLGYAHRDSAGIVPTDISSSESPWRQSMPYPQGWLPWQISQYFTNVGMASNQEETVEPIDDNSLTRERYQEDIDDGLWSERDTVSFRGFGVQNGHIQVQQFEETKQFANKQFSSSSVISLENYPAEARDVYSASSHIVPASSSASRVKQSSQASLGASSLKFSRSARDRERRTSAPAAEHSTLYEKGWKYESESVDLVSSKIDDDNGDWIPPTTVGTEVAESTIRQRVSSSHEIPGKIPAEFGGSKSMLPIAPMLVNSGSRRRTIDNNGVLPFTFYPTGPPVPFVTMLPFYTPQTEKKPADSSTSHFDRGEGFNDSHDFHSEERLHSADKLDEPEIFCCSTSANGAASVEPSEEPTSDILNGDFANNWQNLQYGRLCQNPSDQGPMFYPSSAVVPPMHVQGHFPRDNPGRPLSTNANLFTQLMGYGPRVVPVPPVQPSTNRPLSGHGHYGEEAPRYRSGTGTYLPNSKMPFRERHSSSGRNRVHYSYERNGHHSDRESNWNVSSKQKFAARGRGRNQVEKPHTRLDRTTASSNRSYRPHDTFRPDSYSTDHSQNGLFGPSYSTQHGSSNVAYEMYPLQGVKPRGISPVTAVPPVYMLYPYDQNLEYGPAEHLEFGSLGTVNFPGTNEVVQHGESFFKSSDVERKFQVDSPHSSPDKPSSPKLQR